MAAFRPLILRAVFYLLASATATIASSPGRILCVNRQAHGNKSGDSWVDAYTDLQLALDDVELSGDCLPESPCEIWVAAGTYFPSKRTDPGDPTSATFSLLNNVAIYGGFAGWETDRWQRNIDVNETVLDGDLNQDDDPTLEATSNCCIAHPGEGGCDDPACQQIVAENSPPFRQCEQDWDDQCAATARTYCCNACRPSYCDNSGPIVQAVGTATSAILDGVTITNGDRTYSAGGLFTKDATIRVRECHFTYNYAYAAGSDNGDARYEHCTFLRNRGLGAYSINDEAPSEDVSFDDCKFIENSIGGLLYYSSRLVNSCRFVRNGGVALRLGFGCAPNIYGCAFVGNALGIFADGFPQIANCGFFGNGDGVSQSVAGASVGQAILANCVFSGNRGYSYGALTVRIPYSALLLNCTFVNNSGRSAGALFADGGVEVENSVFWNNLTDGVGGAGILYYDNVPHIDYSVLEDWQGPSPGTGNVVYDPLFMDVDGVDDIVGTEDDDLRLSWHSPIIDLGDPAPQLAPYLDADGHARILRGRIDMGAYEFGIGDYDEDLSVTLYDFAAWAACMTGPDAFPYDSGCEAFDFHAEPTDHIDLIDFAGFQRVVTDAREP